MKITPCLSAFLFGLAATAALVLGGCATPAPDYPAIVGAPDRTEADRATDGRRKPAELLAFYGVRPGMRVLDMGAGAGYNTELLARAVGPTGVVYAQNNQYILENFVKGRLDERMKAPSMKNVVQVKSEFDNAVPPDIRNLDLVTFNFTYHDTTYMGTDRAAMNRSVFNALKPGGLYIVADHSAQPGAGATVGKSLHRIDEALVRREVEAAGFRYVAEGGFLRNPADPRDASVFMPKQPNDEFVLKFVKP
jgi:predicted methyltransferase